MVAILIETKLSDGSIVYDVDVDVEVGRSVRFNCPDESSAHKLMLAIEVNAIDVELK